MTYPEFCGLRHIYMWGFRVLLHGAAHFFIGSLPGCFAGISSIFVSGSLKTASVMAYNRRSRLGPYRDTRVFGVFWRVVADVGMAFGLRLWFGYCGLSGNDNECAGYGRLGRGICRCWNPVLTGVFVGLDTPSQVCRVRCLWRYVMCCCFGGAIRHCLAVSSRP
jgi:hypothetical protein